MRWYRAQSDNKGTTAHATMVSAASAAWSDDDDDMPTMTPKEPMKRSQPRVEDGDDDDGGGLEWYAQFQKKQGSGFQKIKGTRTSTTKKAPISQQPPGVTTNTKVRGTASKSNPSSTKPHEMRMEFNKKPKVDDDLDPVDDDDSPLSASSGEDKEGYRHTRLSRWPHPKASLGRAVSASSMERRLKARSGDPRPKGDSSQHRHARLTFSTSGTQSIEKEVTNPRPVPPFLKSRGVPPIFPESPPRVSRANINPLIFPESPPHFAKPIAPTPSPAYPEVEAEWQARPQARASTRSQQPSNSRTRRERQPEPRSRESRAQSPYFYPPPNYYPSQAHSQQPEVPESSPHPVRHGGRERGVFKVVEPWNLDKSGLEMARADPPHVHVRPPRTYGPEDVRYPEVIYAVSRVPNKPDRPNRPGSLTKMIHWMGGRPVSS